MQGSFSKCCDHVPRSGHHNRLHDKNKLMIVFYKIFQITDMSKFVCIGTISQCQVVTVPKPTALDMYAGSQQMI
jgi:hypothetical protein